MATRKEHSSRPGRESLSKRLGKIARPHADASGALWDRISADLREAGHLDAATEASCCSGSLWDACQDQTALAGLRILEMPGQGRRFGIYLPADERGRHEFVAGPYLDEAGGAR